MYYFDHSATTPVHSDVLEYVHEVQKNLYGNPSSIHQVGKDARSIIEKSRNQIAKAIGSKPNKIIFTSGGTESNNQVLWSRLGKKKNHIISNQIEHPAILSTLKVLKDHNINYNLCSVNSEGTICLNDLKKNLKSNTGLISIMLANNEIGSIQPIKKIIRVAKEKRVVVHTDAVQCLGKIKLNVKEIGVDFLSLSAHKFYGPKGIGILYVKNKDSISPYLIGGGQEFGLRGGTENTASIAGMGLAAEIATKNLNQKIKHLNFLESKFISGLKLIYPKVIINGNKKNKLPGLISASFPGYKSDILMAKLDRQKIYVSNGAACGSGDIKPSNVLKAISLNLELNLSTLRFSFGITNSESEIDYLLKALKETLI